MTSSETFSIRLWKRAFDLLIAATGLLLLSPILLLIAVAVRIALGKPVLFWQRRSGIAGKPFTLCKFRTMLNIMPDRLHDFERMTRLGALLRRTSLDELPELWNVVRGEMSLVGPRPLLMQYLDRYSAEQQKRHHVLPGITGWAQVNGRNAISWEERFALDLWYVDHQGFWLDIKILFFTVVRLLRRDGIAKPGFATMPEFMGPERNGESGSGCQTMPSPSLLDRKTS